MHTFTVSIPDNLSDRHTERVDWAVEILRDIAGVTVSGWCDDTDVDRGDIATGQLRNPLY